MSGLEFGLALAGAIGTIDVCVKYGNKLVILCNAFRAADSRFAALSYQLETHWQYLNLQLDLLCKFETSLETQYREYQYRIIESLTQKLQRAERKLQRVVTPDSTQTTDAASDTTLVAKAKGTKRWKFALLHKSIQDAINDILAGERLFDPVLFQLAFISPEGVNVTKELRTAKNQGTPDDNPVTHVYKFRRALEARESRLQAGLNTYRQPIVGALEDIETNTITTIQYSSARIACRKVSGFLVVLDPINSPDPQKPAQLTGAVRDFALYLRDADPMRVGLLRCNGIVRLNENSHGLRCGLLFVLKVPSEYPVIKSLRHVLLSSSHRSHNTLSDRFELARQIVRAVIFVHNYKYVHKNIRPETILALSKTQEEVPKNAFLIGFDIIRNEDGSTARFGDDEWDKNLYRHPRRQGLHPSDKYIMQHDIYSAGVCLLEIGLWVSFVEYDEQTRQPVPSKSFRISREESELRDPELMKDHLLKLARSELPRKMGTLYSEVVQTCLTCLDPNNENFGDEKEFQDDDGIVIGVQYVEKVFEKLSNISI